MRHILSERDLKLQSYRFRYREPQNFPGLRQRLERAAVPVRILHDYDETPPGGLKAGHRPHVVCAFGHPHWHGYIAEFAGGEIALIGRNCARRHFGDEVIDSIERDYKADRNRQYEVRRLMAVREVLPAAIEELRHLCSDPTVRAFDAVWRTTTQRFGTACRKLAESTRSSQGSIILYKSELDREATAAAADKAAPHLTRAVQAAPPGEQRQVAVAAHKRYLEKNPVYRQVPVNLGRCLGWRILHANGRSTPQALVQEAFSLLGEADDGKAIEKWGKKDFARLRQHITDACDKISEAEALVADMARFASPENLERIKDWAMRSKLDFDIGLPKGYRWPQLTDNQRLRAALADEQTPFDLAA